MPQTSAFIIPQDLDCSVLLSAEYFNHLVTYSQYINKSRGEVVAGMTEAIIVWRMGNCAWIQQALVFHSLGSDVKSSWHYEKHPYKLKEESQQK